MDFLRNVIGVGGNSQLPSYASTEVSVPDEVGSGAREDDEVQFGYAAIQGRRGNMEDFVSAHFKRCRSGAVFGFFGVFDGHGGPEAARYVRDNLFVNLEQDQCFPRDMKSALKETFQNTDTAYLNASAQQGCDDGCTGVTAVVQGRKVWIAHVGDSRAVLCSSSGNAVALSEDHKPSRNDEQERIEDAGGAVIWAGTWRVSGVLAVSRAFGDRPLKKYVIALPDVRCEEIEAGEAFVVLASDGLWDVMSNKEAAEIVRKSKEKVQAAARALTDEAMQRGTTDNVSVVVIRFAPKPT